MQSLSIDQAATALAVSRRTVYNMIRDGRLQTVRTRENNSRRVTVESVDALNPILLYARHPTIDPRK